AAAPGSTLTFDGVDDVVALASTALLKQFEAPRDVTLEAWVKPSTPFRQRAQSKTVQIIQQVSNGSNYGLGLHQLLSPALILDGQDDYLHVPLSEPVTGVTHELWFKTSSPDCGIFSAIEGTVVGRSDRNLCLNGGNIQARIWANETISSTNLNLADDNWHHVAHVFGTIDGKPAQKLYVDGREVGSGTKGQSDFVPPYQNAILIGYCGDAKDHYFKGQIDEVRIWNRVRTLAEIQSSMSDRLTGSEENLIGYWYFDEVTGTTVKDYSSSNKPGTLYGNPQIGGFYWFAGVNDQFVRSRQTFPTNTWSHLAATFRQSYGLEFDGKGGYLDCGNDSTLDISRDLTIEVFLKVADLASGNGILSRGRFDDGTEEQDVPYALFIGSDGRIGLSFQNIKHETKTYYSSGTIGTQFCKIAVTRKREQPPEAKRDTSGTVIGTKVTAWDTITFYINGVASGSSRHESTQSTSDDFRQPIDVGSSNQSLEMGRGFNSTVAFRGTISEVRIWNTAREQGNIAQEIKGNEKGLVSWWQFEENDGNTAFDSKSRNHATIKGAVKWVKDPNPLGSKLVLYYNGALITTDTVSAAPLKSSEPQFTLAACHRSNGIQEYFQGELEEVRIWKTARTQEQIQDNLLRRLLGEQDDLIAYYTFDLDSKKARENLTTLYDQSPRGNDLAITGATYILSTAPLSDDAPIVRSALAGVKTAFHGLIQSQPGIQEYGDMQYDIDGNLIGVFK
ncbi:MAG: LamG domain-containing protein, partial [Kovacikia sp.]